MTRDLYVGYVRKGTQNIKRFGMEDVIRQQSLAEHGYHVMNIFLISCAFVEYTPTDRELDKVLNHDIIETVTGDLNKLVKEYSEATISAWETIEEELTEDTDFFMYSDSNIGFSNKFEKLWRFADAMDAYLYCQEERKRGNQNLNRAEAYYHKKLVHMNERLFRHITRED